MKNSIYKVLNGIDRDELGEIMGQIWVDIEQEFVDYDEVENDTVIHVS